jgi:hypothetical protein
MFYYICKLLCCDFTQDERCRNCKKIVNKGTFMKYNKIYCYCLAGRYTPKGDKS